MEGRYDKLRLESVLEGYILSTDGFGVFKNKEKTAMLRLLAQKTPIIVLTDSDGAGKLIRSHITSAIPPERLIHLYVPRIKGVEKRKKIPSAEGILGVEGMERDLLYQLFLPYSDPEAVVSRMAENPLSKTDLYIDGLTGSEGSREKRNALERRLGLPEDMTPNALLAALRLLCTYEEYCKAVGREKTEEI